MNGLSLHQLRDELAALDAVIVGDGDVQLGDVEQDSRRVFPGALFVARAGGRTDGARFASDAVARGAVAVLAEHGATLPRLPCPVLRVRELPRALAIAAESVHGHPSQALQLVGVTGTNGKTTVAWLVHRVMETLGIACLRLGTLGVEFRGHTRPAQLTTPMADELSRHLARAVAAGGTHAVMEVSSVALSGRRVDALDIDVGAFTNLTRDHLDDHGSFEAYAEAKARLMVELASKAAVINVDDRFGAELARRARARLISVGRSADADVSIAGLEASAEGVRGTLRVEGSPVRVSTRLVGAHNAENLGLAFGIALALELDVARVAEAMRTVESAPGRLERCDAPGDDCSVLVDYAHTPDALERVLGAVGASSTGRLICVFGCGGDRDPGKRFPMGEVAGRLAAHSILTNDNPRTEAPEAIAEAVEKGLRSAGGSFEICLDRAMAIERAVMQASPGDVVLIAGKGHETYQITAAGRDPFDDREQARRALSLRRAAASAGGKGR